MSTTFSSLSVPNYRKYFIGALTSNIGMWIGRTATSWLVLVQLTDHSATALGWVTSLMFLPAILLAPVTGSIADRFAKRRVMVAAQSVMVLDSLLLGLLTVTGHVELWMVYAITLVDGCAGAVDSPARQAFVSEVVGKDQLNNAISLNSASFNAARLLGPGTAGLLIAAVDTGPLFFINATTYLALIGSIVALDPSLLHPAPRATGGTGLSRIRAGIAYVGGRADLVLLMVIAFTMGTFGMNYAMTNALMATEVFGRGPEEYGLLGSLMAVGALSAALLNARRERTRLRHLVLALVVFTMVTVVQGVAPDFWSFALLLAPSGLCAITILVGCNTLVQMSVDADVRGRVMALYMAVLLGGTPIVSPAIGWVGEQYGARWTVLVGAIACGLCAVVATQYILRTNDLRIRLQWNGRWPRLEPVRLTEPIVERAV